VSGWPRGVLSFLLSIDLAFSGVPRGEEREGGGEGGLAYLEVRPGRLKDGVVLFRIKVFGLGREGTADVGRDAGHDVWGEGGREGGREGGVG